VEVSGGKAGEGFSPGKAPSRTLPKSVYGEKILCAGRNCRFAVVSFLWIVFEQMWSSFASFLLTQKKRRLPAGNAPGMGFRGAGGRRLFPGKSPLPHPPEKRIWIKVLCAGRNCRFAVVSFFVDCI